MDIPQDLVRLFSVAVRDAVWYKDNVISLLQSSGVPAPIVRKFKSQKQTPTVQLMPMVISDLQSLGPEGDLPLRRLFTQMCNWKGFSSLDKDKQAQARASVDALKSAQLTHESEVAYAKRKTHEEWEKTSHEERKTRTSIKEIDHAKLQKMRDDFDSIYPLPDERERGNRFEKLMNDLFGHYTTLSTGGFRRTGEQIDGHFYFDTHPYYAEIRWKKALTSAADISVLRDRATSGFGGDTKAVFVSFEGFSREALDRLAGKSGERVILLDGLDINAVLDGRIGLDVLLMEKQMDLGEGKRAFIGVFEVLQKRAVR
jgi:hypothetical protein